MKRKLFLGSIISAVFLYLALRGVDWRVLGRVLGRTDLGYLSLAVIFTMFGHYVRAYRWRILMRPVKTVPLHDLFSATILGFFANNLLPARLGELVRAYALGRNGEVNRTAAFATIVFERVVDLFTLLALLWIVLLRTEGPDWLQAGGITLLAINIVSLALILIMERNRNASRAFIARIARRLPATARERTERFADAFTHGLSIVRQPRFFLPIVVTSVAVWLLAMSGFYFCFLALDMALPLEASLAMIVIVSVGGMIPSAPAYLGTMQYACIVGLGIYGIGKTEALAYSLLYHASQFFPIMALGFVYLWRAHLRVAELKRASKS